MCVCVCVCVCVCWGGRGSVGWVQVTPNVTLSNITLPNNLLLNSYFENPTIELHILYVFNIHVNFHVNLM